MIAPLTSSLKVSNLIIARRSWSLLLSLCLKHACFFSSVSTWYPAYYASVLKAWEYCRILLLPCFRAKNSVSFLLITPAGMWCALNASLNWAQVNRVPSGNMAT